MRTPFSFSLRGSVSLYSQCVEVALVTHRGVAMSSVHSRQTHATPHRDTSVYCMPYRGRWRETRGCYTPREQQQEGGAFLQTRETQWDQDSTTGNNEGLTCEVGDDREWRYQEKHDTHGVHSRHHLKVNNKGSRITRMDATCLRVCVA